MIVGNPNILRHKSSHFPAPTPSPETSNITAFVDKVSRWENRDMFNILSGLQEELKQRNSHSQERRRVLKPYCMASLEQQKLLHCRCSLTLVSIWYKNWFLLHKAVSRHWNIQELPNCYICSSFLGLNSPCSVHFGNHRVNRCLPQLNRWINLELCVCWTDDGLFPQQKLFPLWTTYINECWVSPQSRITQLAENKYAERMQSQWTEVNVKEERLSESILLST